MSNTNALYSGAIKQGLIPRGSLNYDGEMIRLDEDSGVVIGGKTTMAPAPVRVRTLGANRERVFASPDGGETIPVAFYTEKTSAFGQMVSMLRGESKSGINHLAGAAARAYDYVEVYPEAGYLAHESSNISRCACILSLNSPGTSDAAGVHLEGDLTIETDGDAYETYANVIRTPEGIIHGVFPGTSSVLANIVTITDPDYVIASSHMVIWDVTGETEVAKGATHLHGGGGVATDLSVGGLTGATDYTIGLTATYFKDSVWVTEVISDVTPFTTA